MKSAISEPYGSELILLATKDVESLIAFVNKLIGFIDQAPKAPLRDIAFTCAAYYSEAIKEEDSVVLALVAENVAELRSRLTIVVKRLQEGASRIRDKSGTYYFSKHLLGGENGSRMAFIFPGAMSFYPDMLRDLAVRYRVCRTAFDELEEALSSKSSPFTPSAFIFPPAAYYRHDADVFSAGGYAEAVVSTYSANVAMFRLMEELKIKPDGVVGFSGGDLSAMMASGSFGKFLRPARLKFLKDLYHVVETATNHSGLPRCVMVSMLSQHPEKMEEVLKTFQPEMVTKSFLQSPRQCTLAIDPNAVSAIQQALTAVGARGVRLPVDRPFNTSWCKKIVPLFRKFASRWVTEKPKIPVYSCGICDVMPEKARKAREVAADQWALPVRFEETIRKLYADGFRVFIEVGPRGAMSGAVDDVLRGEPYAALAMDAFHRGGVLQLQHVLAAFAALGGKFDPAVLFEHRRCRVLDLDSPLTLAVKMDSIKPLSRTFPRLALMAATPAMSGAMSGTGESVPGTRNKGVERAAAVAARRRRKQQFEFGGVNPLISDADTVEQSPGIALEITKTFSFKNEPFLEDFSLASQQLAYSDSESALRGFTMLPLIAGAEIMAELAQELVPNKHVVAVNDLQARRALVFKNGKLKLFIRAERVASGDPSRTAVKVQIRDDAPNSAWTWPAMEGTFILTDEELKPEGFVPPSISKPRTVHWTNREIYPERLFSGPRLRCIQKADVWSEAGLSYEVEVPPLVDAVTHTRFPIWALNPILLYAIADGFALWRSQDRFAGTLSFAFRLRHLELHTLAFNEGMRLKCYLRLTGVTPKSHVSDILVSDGNGKLLLELRSYEELTERVPVAYWRLLLTPARVYLTQPVSQEYLGAPATPVSSAFITDIPYPIFERNEELWLKTISSVVLSGAERPDFANMPGATSRRTEWLFGRIAAKEAVRRFLEENYQARWTDADVQIWPDDSGKPHPLGAWCDFLTSKIDLAIAHTGQFVVAIVAANARVGVDVESISRELSEEFTHGVFTNEELDLAMGAVNTPSALIRFWCAKEAVSKALGTGIRYSPREICIDSFQPETGEMTVKLLGAWADAFKVFRGRAIPVSSSIVRGHVLASCFIPESLFNE